MVQEAGRLAQRMHSQVTRVLKPDGSIVTEADRAVEEFLRQRLPKLLPDAGILGEELGAEPEGSAGLWCLDPIDGTSNYSFGSPIWGVSVGFVKGEEALAGILFLPDLGEIYLGGQGYGATFNGEKMTPLPAGPIRNEELVSYPDRVLRRLVDFRLPGKMRHSGAFIVDAAFTCVGRYRGLIGMREKLHDIAASLAIAKELDAEIRMLSGEPLELEPLKNAESKIENAWMIFPKNSGFTLQK
jgi:myo-inositol-1(or 4)-monophosphatase